MKLVTDAIAALMIFCIAGAIIYIARTWPFANLSQGELRCEDAGAIIVRVGGQDYAVNGMASSRYPHVQRVWNSASYPETDIDRLIAIGGSLCDWEASKPKNYYITIRDQ